MLVFTIFSGICSFYLLVLAILCFLIEDKNWKDELKARKWGKIGKLCLMLMAVTVILTIVGVFYN